MPAARRVFAVADAPILGAVVWGEVIWLIFVRRIVPLVSARFINSVVQFYSIYDSHFYGVWLVVTKDAQQEVGSNRRERLS